MRVCLRVLHSSRVMWGLVLRERSQSFQQGRCGMFVRVLLSGQQSPLEAHGEIQNVGAVLRPQTRHRSARIGVVFVDRSCRGSELLGSAGVRCHLGVGSSRHRYMHTGGRRAGLEIEESRHDIDYDLVACEGEL